MNLGTGLFDATTNPSPLPSGEFFSWLGQAQRLQRLDDNNLLIVQADLQLTPDSLLPDYLFIIGGGQSLRGYRQNARSADNGVRLSVENRITLARDGDNKSVFELAPFVDFGAVWNSAGNPTQLPPNSVLVGPGLGIIWRDILGMTGLSFRFDYGIPVIKLDSLTDNWQNDGLYFQLNYRPPFRK
jgi:hemolysin activation/secretion protein